MVNKKLMMLAIFLVSLLAVSVVSAADNTTRDIVGIEETTDEVVNIENDEVILKENDVGTFTDLANEIVKAKGELNLTKNYKYRETTDSNYKSGIIIDESIIINGNGYTINGNDRATEIFGIESSNVILNNICFVNVGDYHAVCWSGDNGVLFNCTFANSYSLEQGGAVQWYGSNGNLHDCVFVNSSAGFMGGAVSWMGDYGTLSDCSFINCSAKYYDYGYGGAVYWSANKGTLSDCSFVDCSANRGGAVYWDSYSPNGLLYNCSFVNCFAHHDDYYGTIVGGGIAWLSDNGVVEESSFINCFADEYGGGIYFKGNDCILISGSFEGCTAKNGPDWYSENPLIVIDKTLTVLSAPDVSITYGASKNLVVTLKDSNNNLLAGEEILIVLNKVEYTLITNSKGKVSLALPKNLAPKTYTATISYPGNEVYESSSTTAKIVVSKAGTVISAPDVSLTYKNPNGALIATIINEHGKPLVVTLNINLNGKTYTTKTDSNGQASISIGTLSPGKYTATISYKGSSNYKASTTTAKVTVTKAGTVISAPNVKIAYKDPTGGLAATITNEHGKPLVVNLNVNINGKDYTVKTDSNGQARIAVGTLTPGTYTATISYKGSGNYKASSTTTKVTVTKAGTVISAPNVKIAYKNPSGELVATITNEHGKPLVVNLNVNLNGKDYTVKTDSNGQARIAVGTLTPGTYTATISYKGSSNYKASSTTTKVTVTKAATIITAPDVTVAYKDSSGKLVSTITNEHGKPLVVNLNVDLNGETYTIKTDSNGQISVPTANLAPGTYTAKISYKGSSNYKASSTTAKITVNNKIDTSISVVYDVESKEIVATLSDSDGEAISDAKLIFNLLDMDYSLTTDSKGQAKFSTAYLESGMYSVTVSYEGYAIYNPTSKSTRVIIQ